MAVQPRAALRENLEGWQEDIHPPWRDVVGDVLLAFENVDPKLELEPWEPIFPARLRQTWASPSASFFDAPSANGSGVSGKDTGIAPLSCLLGLSGNATRCAISPPRLPGLSCPRGGGRAVETWPDTLLCDGVT